MATKNHRRAAKKRSTRKSNRAVSVKRGKFEADLSFNQNALAEPPGTTYNEGRFFANGKQWLGYLEGRPGIIMPALEGSHSGRLPRGKRAKPISRAARKAARERIADSAPVVAQPTARARKTLERQLFALWLTAEQSGVYALTVVDNDSQTPDHNE